MKTNFKNKLHQDDPRCKNPKRNCRKARSAYNTHQDTNGKGPGGVPCFFFFPAAPWMNEPVWSGLSACCVDAKKLKMQLLFDDMWLCLTSFDYMGLSAVLPDPFLLTYWRLNYSNPSPTQLPSAEVLASSASSFSPASHVSEVQWRQQLRRLWQMMKSLTNITKNIQEPRTYFPYIKCSITSKPPIFSTLPVKQGTL